MNRTQKMAWWCVICTVAAVVMSVIVVLLLRHRLSLNKVLLYGVATICMAGPLSGLGFLFTKKDKGPVTYDERDGSIRKNAAYSGFAGAFLFACAAYMTPFFVLGPNATISVRWLPQIWIGTFLVQYFLYSLTILVGYGRGGNQNE
jgi:hypothetical protein